MREQPNLGIVVLRCSTALETWMHRIAIFTCCLLLAGVAAAQTSAQTAATKPKLTLDEFFDFVQYTDVKLSPDGNALLIGTERGDWKRERFRKDIWLWRPNTP